MIKILKWIWKWNELITIPFAILLWYLSPYFLHWIDPTAATFDSGIFQVILFTIIQLLIYNGVVFLLIKITWPGLYKFLDNGLEDEIFNNGHTTYYEKVKIVMWIFSLYFIVITLLSRVI
jgi:hypothetical protein